MILSLYILSATVTILAWIVARREREHRAVALLLTLGLATDLIRRWLNAGPLAVPGPYHGAARALFHVEQALFISWSFGVAALALYVLANRKPRIVALAYVVTIGILSGGYPTIRQAILRKAYLGAELVSLAIAFGPLISSLGRKSTVAATSTRTIIVGQFAAVVFGAYKLDLFRSWTLSQASYLTIYSFLILIHARRLLKRRTIHDSKE